MPSLSKSKEYNENYAAKIIRISNIRPHNNADRLLCVSVYGNNVIVGLDAKENDLYIYFPIECSINKEFLSWSNSFVDKELNNDKEKKGFFEKNGRVRCLRLRQERSEGYLIPASQLECWLYEKKNIPIDFNNYFNEEFDLIGEIKLCEKYVPNRQLGNQQATSKKHVAKITRFDRLIEGQFSFHFETGQLARNIHLVNPDDIIQITEKLHGSSFITSKLVTKKQLKWYEKILQFFGVNIIDTHYDILYSSRKVLKNRYFVPHQQNHFYGEDLWKAVSDKLHHVLVDGLSLFGEVVGYTPNGSAIQKKYDYGCKQREFKTYIYRITHTNPAGSVHEFSAKQVQDFCKKYGINAVPEHYYGKAKDLFVIPVNDNWSTLFLEKLSEAFLDKYCTMCNNKVYNEGVILRVENLEWRAWKHKSFMFREQESKNLDAGEVDMETEQALSEEN